MRAITKEKMENKCRCCLTSSPKLQYYSLLTVFPEFARKSLSVLKLLSIVTSSEVTLSKNLPSKICFECFKSLKFVYSFIVSFQHSQKILLKNKGQTGNADTIAKAHGNENEELILDSNEEKIIIITEENDNDNLEYDENIPNVVTIKPTVEAEEIVSEIAGTDLSDDDLEEDCNNSKEDEIEEQDSNSNKLEEEDGIVKDTKSKSHKSECPTPKLFKCEYCENIYTVHKNVLAHIRKKHPQNIMEYLIKVKQKGITSVQRDFEIYKCDVCDKIFQTKIHLKSHNYNFHHPEWNKLYKCDICNEVFKNSNAVRYHKLARHEGKNFTCNLCNKKFISKSTLRQHIIGVHEKRQPENYLCSICGRGFKYGTALKYHMGKQHTHKRDFVCGYCGAAFILLGELRTHERNHTGERPYSCKYCKKTFKRSPERQRHERTHLGIYPFKCEYCDTRVFTSAYNMNVHLLQHRGDYQCEVCSKGFASEEILTFHYKHRHKIKQIMIKKDKDS